GRQLLRIGVAGDDQLLARSEQRFEGVEELLLRAVLAAEELDVVDEQQVERLVLLLELVQRLALDAPDHLVEVVLRVDVAHARRALALEDRVADRVQQVRLAEPYPAVEEQRVVGGAGPLRSEEHTSELQSRE